jgi:tol-pal system protein YbgF
MNIHKVAGAFLVVLALPAQAQLFADDDARKAILELRSRIAALQTELGARIDATQRSQLEMANQNEVLRQEIARLRGQVETLNNEVTTLQRRNRELYADLDARLKRFEPSQLTIDGRAATVERTEQAAYDAALAQFRAGDFRNAVPSFQQFVSRYPASAYVPAAQYFIGSSYFALKDYKASIAANQIVADRYKDSPRAPEALLSIADSQLQMGDKRAANRTLTRVVQEYPSSDAAIIARERLPGTR